MSATPTGSRGRFRFGRLQKAAAIVPIAVLSVAWTASLTGVGVVDTASDVPHFPTALPDGGSVPPAAIEAPASISAPDQGSPTLTGASKGRAQEIVARSSTNEIPSAALAAYQRAETIIDNADGSCHLTWQLIAAIGRVESDHGRSNGSALDDQGVDHPAIYGVRLKTADTDAGLIDGETGYDRAVGPMQFIPSTWQAVAVDADGDGKRDPQDIDDAALGAAVYLCSGDGDLSTTAGQRAAVYRYNHSTSYVDLVLAIMDSYLDGDFMTSPNDTLAGGYLTPTPPAEQHQSTTKHGGKGGDKGGQVAGSPITTGPTPTTDDPGTTDNGGDGDGTGDAGGDGPTPPPGVPGLPTPPVTLPTMPPTHIKPVDHLLTMTQAVLQCTLNGLVDKPFADHDAFDTCVTDYMTTGKP